MAVNAKNAKKGQEFQAGGKTMISDGRGGGSRKRAAPKAGLRQGLGESGASRPIKRGNTFKKKKVKGVRAGVVDLHQTQKKRQSELDSLIEQTKGKPK